MKSSGIKRVDAEIVEIEVPPYATYQMSTADSFHQAHQPLLANQ